MTDLTQGWDRHEPYVPGTYATITVRIADGQADADYGTTVYLPDGTGLLVPRRYLRIIPPPVGAGPDPYTVDPLTGLP